MSIEITKPTYRVLQTLGECSQVRKQMYFGYRREPEGVRIFKLYQDTQNIKINKKSLAGQEEHFVSNQDWRHILYKISENGSSPGLIIDDSALRRIISQVIAGTINGVTAEEEEVGYEEYIRDTWSAYIASILEHEGSVYLCDERNRSGDRTGRIPTKCTYELPRILVEAKNVISELTKGLNAREFEEILRMLKR